MNRLLWNQEVNTYTSQEIIGETELYTPNGEPLRSLPNGTNDEYCNVPDEGDVV